MKSLVAIFLAIFSISANAHVSDKCFKILSTDGQFFNVQNVTVDGSGSTSWSTSLSANMHGQFAKLAGLIVGNDELKICIPSVEEQRNYNGSYIIGLDEWAYQGHWENGYFKV
jgi:hypothetical protein